MNIWIVGASHGIGKAVAEKYLAQGHKVAISARSSESLIAITSKSKVSKLNYTVLPFDVLDRDAIKAAFNEIINCWQKIDLFIYGSAIYKPASINEIDTDYAKKTIDVNLTAVFDFLGLVIPHMVQNQSGHIALIASSAGYVGLPRSYAYGASKAAMINLAQGLYSELSENNIDISVINPGFVKTRLTDKNDFSMPFIITPDQAADSIIRGISKKKFDINFPFRFTFILKSIALLPNFMLLTILKMIK